MTLIRADVNKELALRLNFFFCSTQMSMILILLINVTMPIFVGILTFISKII